MATVHFRERTRENRDRYIGIRVTAQEAEHIDSLLEPHETRSEFLEAAIVAYTIKREKRNLYK